MQTVDIHLSQGESVFTESGGMAWMKGNIEIKTGTKGGLLAGLGRKLAGESLFMTTYTCRRSEGLVVFTPEAPGKVLHFQLEAGQSLICQKDAFMCGEGFILQKVTGPGVVFLEIPGEVREYTLAAGETMQVDPGHIALFEPTVNYDITTVKGVTNSWRI